MPPELPHEPPLEHCSGRKRHPLTVRRRAGHASIVGRASGLSGAADEHRRRHGQEREAVVRCHCSLLPHPRTSLPSTRTVTAWVNASPLMTSLHGSSRIAIATLCESLRAVYVVLRATVSRTASGVGTEMRVWP